MDMVIPEDVMSRELDGEAVLLDLTSGRYFGLNATAARVWALLVEGLDREAITARIVVEFQVTPQLARSDVDAFIDALLERGLLLQKARL